MSQGNPSCLRFSLEESVWFQRGQEVLDLISISLDPDILIQENDQYVTIQGALELSGEYQRNEIETQEAEDTFAAPKFIQVVEEREEGICEFNHYFPVDITIPKNRIENIHDIDVLIESFDYVFPERSCMKLTANLMITGIYGEKQQTTSQETDKEKEWESLYRSSAAVTEVEINPFAQPSVEEVEEHNEDRFEASVEQDETEDEARTVIAIEEDEVENETRTELSIEVDEVENEARTELSIEKEEAINEDRIELVIEQEKEIFEARTEVVSIEEEEKVEIYVPFHAEARKQPEIDVQEREALNEVMIEEQMERKPEISFSAKRNQESTSFNDNLEEMTESVESSSHVVEAVEEKMVQEESSDEVVLKKTSKYKKESPEQEGKQKKKSKKKSMSLTEFFSRKEEKEEVVKVKVCIVQNGDTIDRIAERYDITIQQLLRVNHLEINQEINEGQVLYIPVAVAH